MMSDIAEKEGLVYGESEPFDYVKPKTLSERFIVPPFSVLDARQGYWNERKRAWLALGVESGVGRGDNRLKFSDTIEGNPKTNIKGLIFKSDSGRDPQYYDKKNKIEKKLGRKLSTKEFQEKHYEGYTGNDGTLAGSGTSIFDPVLCELAYRWFMPKSGEILDPFAGGSDRGIVAGILGYGYTGIDLRPEQVEANEAQAVKICGDNMPNWIVGDSRDLDRPIAEGEQFDFIFSCPPYFDLELYSDDEKDLSNAGDYKEFLDAYYGIIAKSVDRLRDNRFACFVVGDIRDKKGFYRNFVSDTIEAFQTAGMTLYNEAILVTPAGSLPRLVGRQFEASRKLGKTHQNVLVFYKGDPKVIKGWGEVECGEMPDGEQEVMA